MKAEALYVLIVFTRFFAVSIVAASSVGSQNYFFTHFAAELTTKLRVLSFHSVMKQDSQFLFVVHKLSDSTWLSTILRQRRE